MADIAARAGVTKMTVSRALRAPETVHADTRERINRVVEELGYIRNSVAGSMSSRMTRMIAAIVPTLQFSVFADTLQGLNDVARDGGYDLLVANSSYRSDIEEQLIKTLLGRRPDGLVLTGLTHSKAARSYLQSAGIPIVETWEVDKKPIDMTVGYSNFEAARAMTGALIKAGYRRIAFVNGPVESNERAELRAEGYRQAMKEHGLKGLPIVIVTPIRVTAGAEALSRVVESAPDVEAIFFTTDVYAVGAILECERRGWAVPGRIAIAGFHDLDIAAICRPALTSVRVPAYEIGRQAGLMLLSRLAGNASRRRRVELPFEIVSRDSTPTLTAGS